MTTVTVRAAWLTNRGDAAGGQTRNDSRMTPLGTMTATLGIGRAVVQGTDIQGAYPVVLTESEPLVSADGDPANPRIDLVACGSTTSLTTTRARSAPPSRSSPVPPVPPPLPTAAVELYHVAVAAGVSADSGGLDFPAATTDVRRYTVAVGGPLGLRARRLPRAVPRRRHRPSALQRHGMGRHGLRAHPRLRQCALPSHRPPRHPHGAVARRHDRLLHRRRPARDGNFLGADLPTTARPAGPRTVPVACSTTASSVLAPDTATAERIKAAVVPGRTAVWIERDRVIWWGGILWPRAPASPRRRKG
jgi:hypothetical protein